MKCSRGCGKGGEKKTFLVGLVEKKFSMYFMNKKKH